MAAPAQSPLRRWKRFFGAFESIDAAMEAADPVLLPRDEFRRARGEIVEMLCDDAVDDNHAEQLCLVLDDVMAESLETLRLIAAMPTVLATTDLAKSVCALREHESERVRALASGIVGKWRAKDHAKVSETMKRLDNMPQPKEEMGDARTKQAVKIREMSAKKSSDPANMDTISQSQPKKMNQQLDDARATRPAKIPETPAKKSSDPGLCYEEKMKAAKRKFNEGYKEAEDAKRQRKTQLVKAPEMLKQRERSRAGCGSSIVKKTFSVTRRA